MSTKALNRLHLGMMGDAQCHATSGWFCALVVTRAKRADTRYNYYVTQDLEATLRQIRQDDEEIIMIVASLIANRTIR